MSAVEVSTTSRLREKSALGLRTRARSRPGRGQWCSLRSEIATTWHTACREAGIVDLRFHDLRREFACRLLESRAELHDVRDFLGHANLTTTSR